MNGSKWFLIIPYSINFASACSSEQLPAQRLADSEATLRAAKQANAEKLPAASLHVQLADEQIAKAQKLIKDGDYEKADFCLRKAKADAELALALAESEQTTATATEAQKKVQSLQQIKNN